MTTQKATARIASAFVVPMALMAIWALIFNAIPVENFLIDWPLLNAVVVKVAAPLSEIAGFGFVARPAIWRTLERRQRQLVLGFGIIYFPVMWYLLWIWAFVVAGSVYHLSI